MFEASFPHDFDIPRFRAGWRKRGARYPSTGWNISGSKPYKPWVSGLLGSLFIPCPPNLDLTKECFADKFAPVISRLAGMVPELSFGISVDRKLSKTMTLAHLDLRNPWAQEW